MIRIQINRDKCMGSGECVYSLPAVFDMDDDSKAVVKGDQGNEQREAVRLAVRNCPNFAISATQDGEPLA